MASSISTSTSSTTLMFPYPRTLLELTTDPKLIQHAIFITIGQTPKKPDGLLPPLVNLVVSYLEAERRAW